jgi:hypothetical protein
MASDNGEQTNQPWSQHPPQQPAGSPWAPSPERDAPEPSDDEPDEATIARPVPPPSAYDASGGAPTTRYSWFDPPDQRDDPAGDQAPPAGSANDERTQSLSRPDLRFEEPTPAPTQQMPSFPPPGVPYPPQPAPPYPPPPPLPQQAYPPNVPYQPEGPAQPGWSQPGYGPPPYQPDSGYPPQQPYGAPPPGYGQYGQYGQQPYAAYAPPAAPKRRRVVLWTAAAVVVVVVGLAIAAFTAKPGFLGFKKVLDHTAVENTIEQAGYTNVVCDNGKNPTVKKGTTFSCTADGGKKITVRITSSSGNYEWSPVG